MEKRPISDHFKHFALQFEGLSKFRFLARTVAVTRRKGSVAPVQKLAFQAAAGRLVPAVQYCVPPECARTEAVQAGDAEAGLIPIEPSTCSVCHARACQMAAASPE